MSFVKHLKEMMETSKVGKLNSYSKPVQVGGTKSVDLIGWKYDTNGNPVLVYEVIKDGKAKKKSTQLGGELSSFSASDYKEDKPSKKVIDVLKDELLEKKLIKETLTVEPEDRGIDTSLDIRGQLDQRIKSVDSIMQRLYDGNDINESEKDEIVMFYMAVKQYLSLEE